MRTNLVIAVLVLGLSSSLAGARRLPTPSQLAPVFAIDVRSKVSYAVPESHFELRADGTWSYVRTKSQEIEARAQGKLSRGQVQRIRTLLARAPWTISTSGIACMAFAATNMQFSVNGRHVWTDELCSSEHLDARSGKRLDAVMSIVNPLIASAK